jgi:hypothetical protein
LQVPWSRSGCFPSRSCGSRWGYSFLQGDGFICD